MYLHITLKENSRERENSKSKTVFYKDLRERDRETEAATERQRPGTTLTEKKRHLEKKKKKKIGKTQNTIKRKKYTLINFECTYTSL